MKIKELIELLKNENQESEVFVSIRQYNKAHPIAQEKIIAVHGNRIVTSLPSGTSTRKTA